MRLEKKAIYTNFILWRGRANLLQWDTAWATWGRDEPREITVMVDQDKCSPSPSTRIGLHITRNDWRKGEEATRLSQIITWEIIAITNAD